MKFAMKTLLTSIDNLHNVSVCVIGDIMLDTYIYGHIDRISQEAPIPIIRMDGKKHSLGGAGNVIRNLDALGVKVNLIGLIGDDDDGNRIVELLGQMEKLTCNVERVSSVTTTVKTRYICQNYQLLRADSERYFDMSSSMEAIILSKVESALSSCDVIIISDYNKGAIPASLCRSIINLAKRKDVPVLVDPKGTDYLKYAGATLIKPNKKELSHFFEGVEIHGHESKFANDLRARTGAQYVLLTMGSDGMLLIDEEKSIKHTASQRKVYDVCGAGDTVIATLAAFYATGVSMDDAVMIANVAAGIAISKPGPAVVTPDDLRTELEFTDKKCSVKSLLNLVKGWREKNFTVGFTNGCFDLIHSGHISTLKFCKQKCDRLIVGLNSDRSVRVLKGELRPINDENQRALILSEFSSVDAVTIFDESSPESLIGAIRPDVLIKGGDYHEDEILGASLVKSYGGKVFISPYMNGYSSTNILRKIEWTKASKEQLLIISHH